MQDPQFDQKMVDDAAFAQQNHPAIDPNQFTDPERQQQQNEQKSLISGRHNFGDVKGDRQSDHEGQKSYQNRVEGGSHKSQPVDGFLKKIQIVFKTPGHLSVIGFVTK